MQQHGPLGCLVYVTMLKFLFEPSPRQLRPLLKLRRVCKDGDFHFCGEVGRQLEGGDLRSGDAVTSERDLAKLHQVSLMTARHTLASVERLRCRTPPRRGALVAAPKIHNRR